MLMLQTRCLLICRLRTFHSRFPCGSIESTSELLFSVSLLKILIFAPKCYKLERKLDRLENPVDPILHSGPGGH